MFQDDKFSTKFAKKEYICPIMFQFKEYSINPETLLFEEKDVPRKSIVIKAVLLFVATILLAVLYFWIYTGVLGNENPKMAILKLENARWASRIDVLNRRLDGYESALTGLEMRNDDVYRSIFGMSPIPDAMRSVSEGGLHSSDVLSSVPQSSFLYRTAMRLDGLCKETYVQSKSFDEVATLSKRAGDMASCIPAISPFCPTPGKYRLSSSFGYRIDPVYGRGAFHEGQDFAMPTGTPLYSTGDGVVETVNFNFRGYGNEIVIDHGFGYKTRYAHMSVITVAEGMKLKRGDCIGMSGNSGKSTGPHLHYEVIYRGERINPMNFVDMSLTDEEYNAMVRLRDDQSKEQLQLSFKPRKK